MLLTVNYANHLRTRMRLFSGLTVREFEPEVKVPFWFHCASSLVNCNEMRSGSGREVNSRWTSNSSREALLIYSTPINLARSPCAKLLTNRILIWTWSNWLWRRKIDQVQLCLTYLVYPTQWRKTHAKIDTYFRFNCLRRIIFNCLSKEIRNCPSFLYFDL